MTTAPKKSTSPKAQPTTSSVPKKTASRKTATKKAAPTPQLTGFQKLFKQMADMFKAGR